MKSKRVISVLASVMILLSFLSLTASASNDVISEARRGVVRILMPTENGVAHGSGFAVGVEGQKVDTFITNNHVTSGGTPLVVLDYVGEGGTYLEATVLKSWTTPDLAIISVSSPVSPWKPLPLLPSDQVSLTQEVWALGFPGLADDLNDLSGNYPSTSEEVTVTTGIISDVDVQIQEASFFQTDIQITGGNSGGPLLTADGAVIGINTLGASETVVGIGPDGELYPTTLMEGLNAALHIDYAIAALDDLGIPYTTAAPAAQDGAETAAPPATEAAVPVSAPADIGGGADGGTLLLIAVAAVVIVAACAVAVRLTRKKSRPGPPQPAPAASPEPAGHPASGPQPPPLLDERTAPVIGQTTPVSSAKIVGVSGQFAGKSFPLYDTIVMGRNPAECAVVFAKGTPGVSAIHCEVQNVKGKAFLTDRGSSYGTFVRDGEKLEPGQPFPLSDADAFYLGEADNQFRIQY